MNLVELPSISQQIKTIRELNLQAITVWSTRQRFVLVPNYNRSRIPTILQIERQTKIVKEHRQLKEETYNQGTSYFFSCLIGIIDLSAEQVNIIGSIGRRDIFKVTKPIYLFYNQEQKKNLSEREAEILLSITAIFEQGMYFSFTYDIATRLNEQVNVQEDRSNFNWAGALQDELKTFDSMWRISFIQGFVGRLEMHISGLKLFLILISRRAIKMGGTQSYGRGIDFQGNTGNQVQTEQIIIVKDCYFSFLQIRGSAPIFWREQTSSYGLPSVKCIGSVQQNLIALKKHLRSISKKGLYKDIFLLNLLTSAKQERKIVQNYQYLVRKLSKQIDLAKEIGSQVRYAYFDVHSECSYKDYTKLNQFLEQRLQPAISQCGFTSLKVSKTQRVIENIHSQTGVFRINCYSCIDRTNIVQSRIAAMKLIEILRYLDIEIKEFADNLKFFSHNSAFSNSYRHLWADNADALSRQYIGTGSTESLAVRKGKLCYMTTLDHGMKSISRVIRNIRNSDEKKQLGISFIINQKIQLSQNSKMRQEKNQLDSNKNCFELKQTSKNVISEQ